MFIFVFRNKVTTLSLYMDKMSLDYWYMLLCPDEIIWPDGEDALPADAQDLITRLLRQSPLERLGTGWWQRERWVGGQGSLVHSPPGPRFHSTATVCWPRTGIYRFSCHCYLFNFGASDDMRHLTRRS